MCPKVVALEINSTPSASWKLSGIYHFLETHNERPAYRHESKDLYLFFSRHWKVGTKEAFAGKEDGETFVFSDDVHECPTEIERVWNSSNPSSDYDVRLRSLTDINYLLNDKGIRMEENI